MNQLLIRLNQIKCLKNCLKKTARMNKVPVCVASYCNSQKFIAFSKFLYQKKNTQLMENQKKSWRQNQLRAFHWILLVVSRINGKLISNFQFSEWSIVNNVFPHKSIDLLKYQTIKFIDQKKTLNTPWKSNQNDLLSQIIENKIQKSEKIKKWSDIGRQLFSKSQYQYFRTGKQCRQRWLNHLDPSKKRGEWTQSEDYIISKAILCIGKKWSEIARLLQSRTQNMVKNRFKSLVIKYKKIYGKSFNQNKILDLIIQNYKGQQLQIEAICLPTIRTRNQSLQLVHEIQIKQNQGLESIAEIQSLDMIQQDGMKQSELLIKELYVQENIILQATSNEEQYKKAHSEQLGKKEDCGELGSYSRLNEIQLIQSPAVWNHTNITPGFYGFSPSGLFKSFSQYEHNFFNRDRD